MRPTVYRMPLANMRLRLAMSLPIKPIAVMLVASGQGLTAVSSPGRKAVMTGISLCSSRVCRYSMGMGLFQELDNRLFYLLLE